MIKPKLLTNLKDYQNRNKFKFLNFKSRNNINSCNKQKNIKANILKRKNLL